MVPAARITDAVRQAAGAVGRRLWPQLVLGRQTAAAAVVGRQAAGAVGLGWRGIASLSPVSALLAGQTSAQQLRRGVPPDSLPAARRHN